ncbi:MAG: hypothetical protein KME27_31415 [Lyngbya sp. HA4199-MV5]|jgi:hypothetical protein|nr:hypothetical protein [Lyngbya sp. HA4199-MV5]
MPSFASPGGRTTTVNTIGGLTAVGRESQELEGQLQLLKLKQAIAAAKGGQSANTGDAPGQLQAARLAAALQQQQAAAGSNQALQTQRLQTGSADLAAKLQSTERLTGAQLAAQMQQLQQRQAGDRTLQGDRIQSTEKINTQNLAAQAARQATDIQGKKDLTTLGTDEELRKRKQAATNALALFNASPGKALNKLNPQAAAAQLA